MASGTLAPRVKYLDIARTIAIISITVNHAVNRSFAVNSNQYAEFHEIPLYLTGLKTVIYAFSRIGVPLFLMISGALLLITVFVIPLIAAARFGLLFLSQYCLAWAGTKVVADLRVDILRKVQEQSMQFYGRIDVGQLMTRATADPQMVQAVIQNMLSELARAPFEILVSVGYIIWFAVANDMMPTLVLIGVGMPAFMLPIVALGKVVRKWSLHSLQRNSVVGRRVHEILTCIRVVKADDTEEFENAKYDAVMHNLVGATMRSVRWGLMVAPMVETVGILLLCGFAGFMWYTLSIAKGKKTESEEKEKTADSSQNLGSFWKNALFIVVGIGALILGSQIFVRSASEVAAQLHVSDAVIGLTIVAGGTSLPELATSIVSARKGQSAIAIGNVIGSNVFNILLILGVTGVISPMSVYGITTLDFSMLVGSMLILWAASYTELKIERWEGIGMSVIFLAYISWLVYGAIA